MGSLRSHLCLRRSFISATSFARFSSKITNNPIILRSFSSDSAIQCENGVSMVQGASRGIGLEFVAAKIIGDTHGRLDLLINTSGILSIPNVLKPETTLSKVEKSSLLLTFEVNAVGPLLVIKHMWPLLKVGGGRGSGREAAIVANLSARVGSIGDNRLGGWHSYRASKTALNQLSKNVALEFERRKEPIICLLLHPGTVNTDLSRPFQQNVPVGKLFTTKFSVEKLLCIIDGAKASDNGKFLAWDGHEIPW
ncbi:uncharacterized protein LOC131065053 isoform X2 [Cryptomeria japonica]|uniref:uncharacterized protein LOC131065053 isoform X2 n=1 Tax=Cryptomeria japonica TaxID=3369 RepID=UPI0025ACBD95|nr:uncharacterized protein LOC131065053 isoform X2 [Cryptomeria japonica]